MKTNTEKIDKSILFSAFCATCEKRETVFTRDEIAEILEKIKESESMAKMWEKFREKNFFVGELQWVEVLGNVAQTMETYILACY